MFRSSGSGSLLWFERQQSAVIKRVRLFEPNRAALQALGNSGIEVNLAVPNTELQNIAYNPSAAGAWVATNIQAYPTVRIESITVGSELIPGPQAQLVLPAMQNIYNSIRGAGLGGRIKVSTVVSTAVTTGFPPSAGVFTPQAMPFMVPIVQFLARTGAPLMVTVYPYFAYVQNDVISLDYALFRANYDVVTDGALRYRNLFDAMVDTVYSAIEKVDVPGLQKVDGLDRAARIPIHVPESGWPSRGRSGGGWRNAKTYDATVSDAWTYNQNLVNHVAQGTPLVTYVFGLFNENLKPGAEIERNFGIFYPNMQPVYNINFP
ncbi:hypothetical protein EJ110_NYTH28551 [Nymphaea thermarum]|nr:hypothetical protein EJ110_NYTH28551 [Nymphaea thermarum]